MSLANIEQMIQEIHEIVMELKEERSRPNGEKMTTEEVARESGLAVATIRQYATDKKIKSRQFQPGVKGSKRYFLRSEVFDENGAIIIQNGQT